MKSEAKNILELFFGFWLHVAANMLGLLLELPLKCGKLFARLIDGKCNQIHVEVYWEFVLFLLIASELKTIFVVLKFECYSADLQSMLKGKYFMLRVVFTT